MRKSYDVIVVGGGVMGLSTAFQIARRSPSLSIIVFEKSRSLGSGSSRMYFDVLRSYHSLKPMCQFSMDGIDFYRNWKDFVKIEKPRAKIRDFPGSVWSWGNYKTRKMIQEDVQRLNTLGIKADITDHKGLKNEWPALSTCGELFDAMGMSESSEHKCVDSDIFVVERGTGYLDPSSVLDDLCEVCVRDKIELCFNTSITDIHSSGGKVTGVTTMDGKTIDAGVVINTSGPWCNKANELAGVEIPFTFVPTRIPVLFRSTPDFISNDQSQLPHMCDMPGGIYFRPHYSTGQLLVSTVLEEDEKEETDPDHFNSAIDPEHRTKLLNALHHRIPALAGTMTEQLTGMCGMYTRCLEDSHPVIGQTKLKGYYIANGFSGHGFKTAPAVGSLLAQLITKKTLANDTEVDPEFFSPYRNPHKLLIKNVLS